MKKNNLNAISVMILAIFFLAIAGCNNGSDSGAAIPSTDTILPRKDNVEPKMDTAMAMPPDSIVPKIDTAAANKH